MDNSGSSNRNKKTVASSRGTNAGGGPAVTMSKSKRSVAPPSFDSQTRRKTLYGGASKTMLSSSSKKNVSLAAASEKLIGPGKPPVRVIDDDGQDVTPQPLLLLDPSVVRKNQSNILVDSSNNTPTDLMSQASIYQMGTVTASTFGGGPFTRSVFSASQSGRSTESISDDLGEPSSDLTTGLGDIKHKREEVKEELSEEALEREIAITLTETETVSMLELPSVSVSRDSDEAGEVRDQIERYQELRSIGYQEELVKSRVGNDRFSERGMNTFNEPPKMKAAQTNKIALNDVGVVASTWDMHDTYQALDNQADAEKKEEEDELARRMARPAAKDAATETDKSDAQESTDNRSSTALSRDLSALESRGTISSLAGTDTIAAVRDPNASEQDKDMGKEIMASENLYNHLVIMERAVNLNTYQPKQAAYRGMPIVQDNDKMKTDDEIQVKRPDPVGAYLDRLWAYVCPLTMGRNVSCITWNKVNPDLLAVGYGQFEFTQQRSGLVCCWSLKNPEYPERVYTCPAGVTAMDFSMAHPNLLTVGLYDGTVAIYNVCSRKDEPILDSLKDLRSEEANDTGGKHTGPVWQLRWIEKERGSGEEKTEVLVSISQDGRITQWSIRKGFESNDLMKLKRVSTRQGPGKSKKSEAFISRYAGGLCFDFSNRDTNIYLAGTDEGHIHRCSCSYNEQYLDSYLSHTGPVYAIQWSPFIKDIFLSCSSDWSVKLWHIDKLKPILTFHASTKAVPSVCWSPQSSTVFACVSEGTVEVWDLSQSTLDPVIVNTPVQGAKLSTVTFAKNSNCLLVGDSTGQVAVYELKGMPIQNDSQVQSELLTKVIQASLASQLNKH